MESRSQVELPGHVEGPIEVYVNGVPQLPGVDYDHVGRMLVFRDELAHEGRLGFWRWLSLVMGVAGTYRRHDTVDVIYMLDGQRTVASLQAERRSSSA